MATTTNFGWETPDDTDLVKDGAAAMRTLGNSIDTSLVDLKGGTTGQILSKASNTDMDFTWTSANPGDIEGVTAGAGLSGGGTSGTVTLNLNSLAAGRNALTNGGFDVWQRGTSIAISGGNAYGADRWNSFFSVAQLTVSRQSTNDTTNLPFIQYCARVQRNNGTTTTGNIWHTQSLETVNSIRFAGQTVNLSFYARKGANFSAASDILNVQLLTGTGTDQNLLNGYTGSASPINQNATLTTTWQRFSYSATLSSSLTELGVAFIYNSTGTAGANDWFEITGVQLELGSSATPFSRAGGTIQGELAACQRYYWRFDPSTTGNSITYSRIGAGSADTTSTARITIYNPTTMRKGAASLTYGTTWIAFDGVNSWSMSTLALDTTSPWHNTLVFTSTSATMSVYRFIWLYANGSSTATLGFDAEL